MVGHVQARHDDADAPPAHGRDGHLALHLAELAAPAVARVGQEAHVVQLLEEEGFVLRTEGGSGREEGEEVGELALGNELF